METTTDLTALVQEHNVRVFSEDETTEDIISALIADRIIDDEPVFVIDIGAVKRSFEKWKEELPDVQPHFAVKSNSDPLIIKVLAALGCNFDCASHNEISSVLEYATPDRIIFAHPVKDCKTLSYAREVDVDLMVFDSSNELLKIALYAPNANLLLRLKVDDSSSLCRFGTKFGVDQEDVGDLLALAKTLHLNVTGFSFHVGSGARDPQLYLKAMEQCAELTKLGVSAGQPIIIDIGGGFSSETFVNFADVIRSFVTERPEFSYIAEPGRLFVNDCATLVISVIGKKKHTKDGETTFTFYVNESVYGLFNNKIFDYKTIDLQPFNEREAPLFKSRVFGRTCDSIDLISDECMLPDLAVGERLYCKNMGAYSAASASSAFNGFVIPKTVYVVTI